ncbi:D-amino acid dehydrogenase [Roseateles albus]|uniref:D-amino acid dehydrogenase n=1 Tax=Roseateles albus TaxID=2987525 RepID=A0ABT5KDZ0_9BURK|nr:D-amino acid dehydrogenase [Roseateles albus]MDC8772030.1 D-amino acid dehydrogenase [Roseateles albus]
MAKLWLPPLLSLAPVHVCAYADASIKPRRIPMQHCVVIGGGIVGLTTAWALAERGLAVTLVERASQVAAGASQANGGQLSYRYVSPLADEGVPLKALRWLLDADGPLRFKPELRWQQWSWMFDFLRACRGPVNRRMTDRLLALGAYSHAAFDALRSEAGLDEIALREPGKLVVYRKTQEFARVAARIAAQAEAGKAGPEQALSHDECVALEPALGFSDAHLAGGIFTAGEAVADCRRVCDLLLQRLQKHANFRGLLRANAEGFVLRAGSAVALRSSAGEIAAEHFVLAAGLQSRSLGLSAGIKLPIYPLKGYSLTAPIAAQHRPPLVSVTDFEKKVVYARIGDSLRVAAMVDLVGDDERIDPARIASLRRTVLATFPQAADYALATEWAGLRPATPSGAPILGASGVRNLWLNVGHGALGFTFSFGTANIVAELVAGRASPIDLQGLQYS